MLVTVVRPSGHPLPVNFRPGVAVLRILVQRAVDEHPHVGVVVRADVLGGPALAHAVAVAGGTPVVLPEPVISAVEWAVKPQPVPVVLCVHLLPGPDALFVRLAGILAMELQPEEFGLIPTLVLVFFNVKYATDCLNRASLVSVADFLSNFQVRHM